MMKNGGANKMGSLLSVTNRSAQPVKFLEITYNDRTNKEPAWLNDKGVTFDSAGISLKPSAKLVEANMGKAANVAASISCR